MRDRWLIDWWLFWQFLLDYINTDHDFPCQIGTTLWKGKTNDQENTSIEFEKIWILGAPSGTFSKNVAT